MVVEERAADDSKVSRTTGRDYIILETIAGLLNFSFRAIPLSDKTEIMEDVQNRTSFLRSTKMALLFHLRQKLDSTFMIEESTMTFAMAKPLLPPRWQSLYHPFSGQVWAAVVGLLFLVPPTLLLVARLEVTITSEEGEGRSPPGPLLVTQDVVGTLLGQDLTRRLPSRSSTQIVVGAWLVLAFIVGTAYRGNLTAFLTVLKYPPRPENLEQLLKTDARVAMHRSLQDYFYNYYKHSNSTMFRELADRTYLVASHADGLQKAMNKTTLNRFAVFIKSRQDHCVQVHVAHTQS
ncbi:ionotropic receptor 93a-like [Procambarus clarkii]|uniref:ionotropic receptor 93a-like n=1 Tax=Procambarus clarkii TaxID=6728 RepID=UPI003741E9F8